MAVLHGSERQSNQSSVRLLHILECVARNRMPMRLQDIAKQAGMTDSTVSRYLYALQDAGYVYQDEETSRYAMTWLACCLTENLNTQLSLRNITTPFVNKLANTLALGACLVIEQDMECVYLDCIDNPSSPTLQRIGKMAPMHATGSGKILLSRLSDVELNEFISVKGLQEFTEYTITTPDALKKELETIRKQDYAMDEEECEIGLRCISCPLRDYSGKIIASMSVFGRTLDMTNERIQTEIYPALKESATIISSRLGYRPTN